MHDFIATIWKGEKFDDFMHSNADIFIIMIGTNDNIVPGSVEYNRTVLWNNEEAVDKWINTYLELAD